MSVRRYFFGVRGTDKSKNKRHFFFIKETLALIFYNAIIM